MITRTEISMDLRKFRRSGSKPKSARPNGELTAHETQQRAMDAMGDSHHILITAPTGAGKLKTIRDAVTRAARLHSGKLPDERWLRSHGNRYLVMITRKTPAQAT